MFYSQYILTRRGPLSKIWLAAHMQNKLTKTMVFSIDLVKACEKIIAPEAPMALRLTSNLLLGAVRVFSRKARYLLSDCSDAVSRIKLAFKISTAPVDLPQDSTTAAYGQVTLDEATADTVRDRVAYDIAFDRMTQLQLEPMLPLDLTGEFQAAEEDITMAPEAAFEDGNLLETAEFELEGRAVVKVVDEEAPLIFEPLRASADGDGKAFEESPEITRRTSEPSFAHADEITLETPRLSDGVVPMEIDEESRALEKETLDVSLPGTTEITFLEEPGIGDDDGTYLPVPDTPGTEDLLDTPVTIRPRRRRRLVPARFDQEPEISDSALRTGRRNASALKRTPKKRQRIEASVLSTDELLQSSLLRQGKELAVFYSKCLKAGMDSVASKRAMIETPEVARAGRDRREESETGLEPQLTPLEEEKTADLSVELARDTPVHVDQPELALEASPPFATGEGFESSPAKDDALSPVVAEPVPELPLELEIFASPRAASPIPADLEVAGSGAEHRERVTLTEIALTSVEARAADLRSARQAKLASLLDRAFESSEPELNFTNMLREEKRAQPKTSRRTAARTFLELVTYASNAKDVSLSQAEPYSDILIGRLNAVTA
ncbi:hypothetical protein NDN08_001544 [Rhodosorus marinus]|uniref:Rad21/Rec8-like protein N-terminal domain-containing protein n=1 Tax=Rhodosorus marinus TaxID=101924 RepID=A0AAV8UVC2_9RHOD|nr:hypothetical protein NDN08_001544 [Rhodosorus marinus]